MNARAVCVRIHGPCSEWSRGSLGPWGRAGRAETRPRSWGEEGSCASAQSVTPSLAQERPPYNLKAFRLCISFPREYPFQPPTVKFTTRIYHPNVDRDGRVCLPIISKKNWKASTRTCQGGGPPWTGPWTEWVGGGVPGPLLCRLLLFTVAQSLGYVGVLCDPRDCAPGSSVCGVPQARDY